ncbi:hypothetical protein GTC3P0254_06000 [Burkholderia pseudomallei]|nr:hypothetical protein GTC019_01450 [Burkholderia pseudomallei]BEH22980.1 hypothetical protein GTC050_02320 [Burkholderia pseudomallei]BEH28976.1 hypothetical protein GTC054_01920 [Burkholderia pseudomallei]BEH35099.1 hypothetical protein GTC254T_01940 [Burkholderia pseudomallei]BEH41007.1 hypothetical protein KNG_02080 [Burkholderia pseudomallei]
MYGSASARISAFRAGEICERSIGSDMAAARVRNVETGGIVQEWRSAAWGFWPFGRWAAGVSKSGAAAGKVRFSCAIRMQFPRAALMLGTWQPGCPPRAMTVRPRHGGESVVAAGADVHFLIVLPTFRLDPAHLR